MVVVVVEMGDKKICDWVILRGDCSFFLFFVVPFSFRAGAFLMDGWMVEAKLYYRPGGGGGVSFFFFSIAVHI